MARFDLTEIPHLEECGITRGAFDAEALVKNSNTLREREILHNKIVPSLENAVLRAGLKDGMTISFHHHFRNGDYIVNMVLDRLAQMGYRNLVVAASSLSECHGPLVRHIRSGVIRRIETSGLRGELADAVSRGDGVSGGIPQPRRPGLRH